MPTRLLVWSVVVLLSLAILQATACVEEEPSLDERLASRLRACGLLSSGKTTNFWWTDNSVNRCLYSCLIEQDCADLGPITACGPYTDIHGFEACYEGCIPEPVDCGDGTTVPGNQVCDGVNDCENWADESGCYPQFHCANGSEVISAILVCNDLDHCSDGSDEADCSPSDFFQCADGNGRVPFSWVCNEWPNCDDGSDESGCAEYTCD